MAPLQPIAGEFNYFLQLDLYKIKACLLHLSFLYGKHLNGS